MVHSPPLALVFAAGLALLLFAVGCVIGRHQRKLHQVVMLRFAPQILGGDLPRGSDPIVLRRDEAKKAGVATGQRSWGRERWPPLAPRSAAKP